MRETRRVLQSAEREREYQSAGSGHCCSSDRHFPEQSRQALPLTRVEGAAARVDGRGGKQLSEPTGGTYVIGGGPTQNALLHLGKCSSDSSDVML